MKTIEIYENFVYIMMLVIIKKNKKLEDIIAELEQTSKVLDDLNYPNDWKWHKSQKELEDKLKECKEKCNDDLVVTDDKEIVNFIIEVLDKAIPHSAKIKNYRDDKHFFNKNKEISDLTHH